MREIVNSQEHKDKTTPGSLSSAPHLLQQNPRTSCSLKHMWRPIFFPQGMQLAPLVSH